MKKEMMDENRLKEFLRETRYNNHIDWGCIHVEELLKHVRDEMPDDYTEEEFLERVAYRSGSFVSRSVEYDHLATSLLMVMHDRKTHSTFMEVVRELQDNKDIIGRPRPILSEEFVGFMYENTEKIEEIFRKYESFLPTHFGWKTLVRAYLLRANGRIVERISHMMMRIALFIHQSDWTSTERCYRDLMMGTYTHATPTLYHAGTRRSQMASCFIAGSEIWTMDGMKKIEDVRIGDSVLTHSGQIGRVTQSHINPRGKRSLYKLYTTYGYVATATGDHEF